MRFLSHQGLTRILTFTLLLPPLILVSAASAQSAFVRINQLGYEVETDNRAYLMSLGSEAGAAFRVITHCMQHQVANILGSLDGRIPRLNGALVEGPNSFAATGFLDGMRVCPAGGGDVFKRFNANGALYRDDQESYSTVEPAIDLTASSFLMFAWRIAGAPAKFAPSEDFSAALDTSIATQSIATAANHNWPIRRSHGARHRPHAGPQP